jgi:hypothetical protein
MKYFTSVILLLLLLYDRINKKQYTYQGLLNCVELKNELSGNATVRSSGRRFERVIKQIRVSIESDPVRLNV